MYKINPGEARTDLYGINKGEAQVFDTSQTERVALMAQKQQADAAKQKQKEEDKRLGDITTQLGAMSSVAYMPRDRELIAGKTQGVKDYVLKNIDKLTKGDPASMIEFQNLYGDLKSTAEQSKNAREQWEQQGNKIAANPDLYRPEATDYHLNFASKAQAGNYAYDTTQLKHNVDYGKHVLSELMPAAQKMAKQSGYSTDFTDAQAKELIANDLTDPVKFEQIGYDFSKAKPEDLAKLGNPKTPIEYAQAKYAPQLIVRDRKPIPMSERNGGDSRKLPKVAGTYTDYGNGKGEFQFEYTNTTDNPYLTIPEPGSKNISPLKKTTIELFNKPEFDSEENRKKYYDNLRSKGVPNDQIEDLKNYIETGVDNDGQKAIEIKPYKVIFDGKNTKLVGLTKPGKNDLGEDVPGKEVSLDYSGSSDVLNNKFGIKNVYDIQNDNAPKHVTVKRSTVPSTGSDSKYNIKGKAYSLKELTDLGYTEEQVAKFKGK